MPTEAEVKAAKAAAKKAEEDAAEEEEDPSEEDPKEKVSWTEWLAEQPKEVQDNYEDHVGGLKSALTAERVKGREATRLSKELKKFEDAEKAKKEEELTDLEKLQEKHSELEGLHSKLEGQLADERLKQAITTESVKLKFTDPDDAFTLLDLSQVEQDDDGKYENIEALLKELAKAKPYLIDDGSGGRGSPNKENLKKKSTKTKAAAPKINF